MRTGGVIFFFYRDDEDEKEGAGASWNIRTAWILPSKSIKRRSRT